MRSGLKEILRSGTIASLVMMPAGLMFQALGWRIGHYGPKFAALWIQADHLSTAPCLQQRLGGTIAIGSRVTEVQKTFGGLFNVGSEFARLATPACPCRGCSCRRCRSTCARATCLRRRTTARTT